MFSPNDKAADGVAVSVGLVEGGHTSDDSLALEGGGVEERGKALQLLWALLEEPSSVWGGGGEGGEGGRGRGAVQ